MSDNAPTFANFLLFSSCLLLLRLRPQSLVNGCVNFKANITSDKLSGNESASLQQNSAVINHAYDILVNPDSRANYLLELSGQELNTDHSIADLDFLDDAMEMRRTLMMPNQQAT